MNDAPSVLTTVARMRSRLRVFVNSGSLHPPTAPNRLFALYDRILRTVPVEGGAFHPKAWALRFDPISRPEHRDIEPVYRVLTASRNVADSGCWELGVQLEGRKATVKQTFGSDVSAFFKRVASSPSLPKALWKLIDELKSVEFKPPREAADELRFDWQWPGSKVLINRIPRAASRALVISPFVRGSFLDRLCSRVDDLTVVSTQRELDALSDQTHAALGKARVYVVAGNDDDEITSSLALHAKLLAWESAEGSESMVGSANATGSGFGCASKCNCEAIVSMRPGLGIDAVLKAFVLKAKDELHGWIEEYQRRPEVVDANDEATKQLQKFQRYLCAEQIRGEYDVSKKTLKLLTRATADTSTWPSGVHAEIIPMLQRDLPMWVDYRQIYGAGANFAGIDLEDVAAFAFIALRDERHKDVEVSFVVQFELNMDESEADARDIAVNRRLLEGVDARSLLLNVLSGLPGGTSRSSGDASPRGGRWNRSVLGRVSIERILEACTADPSRVDEVEAVLTACGDAENMSSFREFWAVFRESLAESLIEERARV
jgi:hypothetical protein